MHLHPSHWKSNAVEMQICSRKTRMLSIQRAAQILLNIQKHIYAVAEKKKQDVFARFQLSLCTASDDYISKHISMRGLCFFKTGLEDVSKHGRELPSALIYASFSTFLIFVHSLPRSSPEDWRIAFVFRSFSTTLLSLLTSFGSEGVLLGVLKSVAILFWGGNGKTSLCCNSFLLATTFCCSLCIPASCLEIVEQDGLFAVPLNTIFALLFTPSAFWLCAVAFTRLEQSFFLWC